jgi:hypothetical protein
VKLGKKEKMKMRRGLLVNKLDAAENEKKEEKAKKIREKVVIVKDIKPMLDDLEFIEKEIEEKDKSDKLMKLKKPQKKLKPTMKQKAKKKQFMADLEFLKAATAVPEYIKDPMATVHMHLKNTIGVEK